jgi:hypothetical protein
MLMLFSSITVGAASGYAAKGLIDKDKLCVARQNERDYRKSVYSDLELNETQSAEWDAILDARRRAVNEAYAPARIIVDSINSAARAQQWALLTEDQRERLRARIKTQEDKKQKQQNSKQQSDKNKSNTPRPNP